MSSEIAVHIKDICKSYGLFDRPSDKLLQMFHALLSRFLRPTISLQRREFHALRDISICITKGETVGIIGRNGSGKSTLLQVLCGNLHPSHGSVDVHGRVAALLELGSGFHPDFTGRENVFLNASILGLSHEKIVNRFDTIAAFADIGDFMNQPLRNYSSGMAMRLAFSVLAHVDADILVIDEALSVGDAFFTQKCMRFLRTFMRSGTVIFVSHDIEAVKALCSRVVWLDAGRVRKDGPTKEVCQSYLDVLLAGEGTPEERSPAPIWPEQESLAHEAPRQKLCPEKSLTNDICVVAFDRNVSGVGIKGCTIGAVKLTTVNGMDVRWLEGGETVRLDVEVECHQMLNSPIIGFMVKDRTGQALFGDNTWLTFQERPLPADAGERIAAAFTFEMPYLPVGDYSMVVAVANGTQQDNIMHHWLHEALHFKSVASNVSCGLVGIPMRQISLTKMAANNGAAPPNGLAGHDTEVPGLWRSSR